MNRASITVVQNALTAIPAVVCIVTPVVVAVVRVHVCLRLDGRMAVRRTNIFLRGPGCMDLLCHNPLFCAATAAGNTQCGCQQQQGNPVFVPLTRGGVHLGAGPVYETNPNHPEKCHGAHQSQEGIFHEQLNDVGYILISHLCTCEGYRGLCG